VSGKGYADSKNERKRLHLAKVAATSPAQLPEGRKYVNSIACVRPPYKQRCNPNLKGAFFMKMNTADFVDSRLEEFEANLRRTNGA